MTEVKHIVFAVTNDLVRDQRMHRICQSLVDNRHSVTLIGRKLRNSPELRESPYQQLRLDCWFTRSVLFYLEYNIRLFLALANKKMDVICACDSDTLLACGSAAWVRRKPLVFDAHEYFTEVPELTNKPFVRWTWRCIERLFIPLTRARYTVSFSLADELERNTGKAFEVIRNLPDVQPTEPSGQMPNILIYQGMLNEGRGLENTIRALQQLDDFDLWIVGTGIKRNTLESLVEQLNLQDRITFFGFVYPDEIPQLTRKAGIGLNLLDTQSLNYYYSAANKYFDYINSGIPCLTMNTPEYRRYNRGGHLAVLLDNTSVKAIVDAVKYLSGEDHYRNLKQNISQRAEEFTWTREKEKLLTLYNAL